MRPGFFFKRPLSAFLAGVTCCALGHRMEESPVAERSISMHASNCSTSEHRHSTHQSEDTDDTTIMMQSPRLKVEHQRHDDVALGRHDDVALAARNKFAEPSLLWARRSNSSPQQSSIPVFTFPGRQQFGNHKKHLTTEANGWKEAPLSLLSRFQVACKSLHGMLLEGMSTELLMAIAVCSLFILFATICMMVASRRQRQSLLRNSPVPTIRGFPPNANQSNCPPSPPTVFASCMNLSAAGRSNLGKEAGAPTPSLLSATGSMSSTVSKHLPPPLCPSMIISSCEARFGVPMSEFAKLTAEGELVIVGISGDPLLRASVCRVAAGRSLSIKLVESDSVPRVTIEPPKVQAQNRDGDLVLEIRGPKGSLYGLLELRADGACCVSKDGQTLMVIDAASGRLQLYVKSGLGNSLASVNCTKEGFGGVEHVDIRVQPGVDTILVLACVLAVLLLSP